MTDPLADLALSVAVAERVMGWQTVFKARKGLCIFVDPRRTPTAWNPLMSMSDCWQIVEAMRKSGWTFTMAMKDTFNQAAFNMQEPMLMYEHVDNTNIRIAIIRAALAAKDSER